MRFFRTAFALAWLALLPCAYAEDFHLSVHIRRESGSAAKSQGNAGVVVWLTPLDSTPTVAPLEHVRMVQKDKRFVPHQLVITRGTSVVFPNLDPFFHNVFSIYKGKRFDLGLYEAGSSRSVEFDRPGVSFIFCNIHPEMSGIILVLDTPYYAVSNEAGEVRIHDVPPGRYQLNFWYERSSSEDLHALQQKIAVPLQPGLGVVEVPEVIPESVPHKNKYGKDYDTSNPYKP